MSNDDLLSDNGGRELRIAPQAFTTVVNPLLKGSEYWSLHIDGVGSARFEGAWALATGKDVKIGLVDEGVNYTHLDLRDNYATDLDYDPRDKDADWDALPDDAAQQHGTKVAGIIAGSVSNTIGSIGAAPEATITASYIRYGMNFNLDEVVDVMAQQSRFDVSNNSWGFLGAFADNFLDGYFDGFSGQLQAAATNGRAGLGTAMVVAGGNGKLVIDGQNVGDDSNFHNFSNSRFVIAVGAHDASGEAAMFSSPGTNILISAPGVGLVTTGGAEVGSGESAYVSGTSFAAPLVSSAIALMLEVNPELGYRDIQEMLAVAADPSKGRGAAANGAGNVNGGGMVFDREMGFGALDAEAAVKLARHWTKQSTARNEEHLGSAFALPDQFDSTSQSLEVTIDNAGADGFAIDFVELTLEVTDADLKGLSIELVSPQGTKALIAPNLVVIGDRTYLSFKFSSVATWGESPFGTWTLNLKHPAASDGFVVHDAKLDIYGDSTGPDDTYYYTNAYARLVAQAPERATASDKNGGTDTLNFAAADSRVILDLSGSSSSALGGAAIHLDDSFENAIGTTLADRMAGSGIGNVLVGDLGDDWLDGRGGDDTLDGGDGDDMLVGGAGADKLDGGRGKDTADYSSASSGVVIDLHTGIHSGEAQGDAFISIERFQFGVHADRFVGSAAGEMVLGGGGNDMLAGAGGNDSLDGGDGADRMNGGDGDDLFFIDNSADVVVEGADGGRDTVRTSVGHRLSANVENLVLVGNAAINAVGNGLNNEITGNGGANLIIGGAGADKMSGGNGNDVYDVDQAGDIVIEQTNQGIDTVRSSVAYTLGANVENLTLTGRALTGTGNALANTIIGNAEGNHLSGGAGNDTLDGGTGADRLTGGSGNDVYVVDSGRDVVVEYRSQGADTVRASVSYALGAHVEKLVLTGNAYRGSGNALANEITGNTGANQLLGGAGNDRLVGFAGDDTLDGGTGTDRLIGGVGNDIYVVDNSRDVVVEYRSQGTDTIRSSVSYTLGAHVEKLVLTGGAYRGTGNALANEITGHAGANHLQGGAGNDRLAGLAGNDTLDGGTGADRLIGGVGNDVYVVDNSRDVVVEYRSQGTDTVRSSVNYTIGAHVEKLVLTGGAYRGVGNALANEIRGNAAANLLEGGAGHDRLNGGAGNDIIDGGLGKDWLTGGSGRDVFDFDLISESGRGARRDVITDFGRGLDRIDLSSIDADTGRFGNQAFFFDGEQALSGEAGQLVFSRHGVGSRAATIISADVNGDGVADLQIELVGHVALRAGDFIL